MSCNRLLIARKRILGLRCGASRIEVIVVALIAVGVIGFMLLPSLQSRQNSRRNICANNMRNTSFALLQNAELHREFLGYANVVGGKRSSWVIPILPYLEQNAFLQAWIEAPKLPPPSPQDSTTWWPPSHLSDLICPTDRARSTSTDSLSYVVNCGSALTANDFFPSGKDKDRWVEDVNAGVFFNRARADLVWAGPDANPPAGAFTPDDAPKQTLQFINFHDGTAQTILMTENLQAGNWATDATSATRVPSPMTSEFQIKQNTGFVWFITGNRDNVLPSGLAVQYNADAIAINALANATPGPPPNARYPVAEGKFKNGGLSFARPSSAHPGGVNMVFCDGHLSFVSDEIDYKVFTELMTPNGRDAIVELPNRTAKDAGWTYQLRDTDYQ